MGSMEIHRWTRAEYRRIGKLGLLGSEPRAELVEGIIYDKPRQCPEHATGLQLAGEALRPLCPPGSFLRAQMPLALSHDSEPEPDVAVVPGSPLDYSRSHPTTALLVVEVADSSLRKDRGPKRDLYARVGIPEYWIVDLAGRTLEVYRDPVQGIYRSRQTRHEDDSVSPLFAPRASIPALALLPSE